MQSQGQGQQLSQMQSAAHSLLQHHSNATGSNLVGKQNDLQSLSSVGKEQTYLTAYIMYTV